MHHLTSPAITIRPAYADDDQSLVRLAALDSADAVPGRPLLVAEIENEIWAALSLSDGTVIADPFHRTRETVDLLRLHAAARAAGPGRRANLLDGRRRDRARRGRRRPLLVG